MKINIEDFNLSAPNTLMTTAQWKGKKHWSADLFNWSRQSIIFVRYPLVRGIRRLAEWVFQCPRPASSTAGLVDVWRC